MKQAINSRIAILLWWSILVGFLVWSVINPKDYFIWFLEASPAVIGAAVVAATHRRFPLTRLVYVLILLHAIVLIVGAHYTYAEMPLFTWLSEIFDWDRNYYDKLGHFMQGFAPAIVAREILLRNQVVKGEIWLAFLIVSVCLAISAFYELVEWWVALASGESADAFLALQGDVWDTQSDMATAMLGAALALLLLSRLHDRQLARFSW